MKILHVLRAPIGGLFRHVFDLAEGQAERGHDIGIIADCSRTNAVSERMIAALTPRLTLGFSRVAIPRAPGLGDARAVAHVARRVYATGAEVIHGHGAKGGALARLVPATHPVLRVYTPHGGSLHDAVGNRMHILMERVLKWRSDLCLFESAYSADMYRRKIGSPKGHVRVVHNGVRLAEFEPVRPGPNPADFVFVGEMRELKGVDLLIEAIDALRGEGIMATAALVGDGPQLPSYRERVTSLGLDRQIVFPGSLPARQAFALGRTVVVPSRAESLPYIVLEAAAAEKPVIAARVGGIPEIFGRQSDRLISAGRMEPLRDALRDAMESDQVAATLARDLCARVRRKFSAGAMIDAVLDAYAQASEVRGIVRANDGRLTPARF
ncbi:MAG: Glycosyltransferase [Pseudolabrys sp.]|jgi:glycosyltransferase involved in cell wall biosynthesis|nr:Glycosyltransferase [Pseudolabrys sp.]